MQMKARFTLTLLFAALTAATVALGNLKDGNQDIFLVYEWTQLEFDYPSESARQQAIDNKEFNAGYIAPIDVDIYHGALGRKTFISVPRFQQGVPVTLGTVTQKTYRGNPVIAPFPSWRWHQNITQCLQDRLVSVFRIKIDECNRVWVLDAGRLLDDIICSPQILAFDVHTGALLYRYEIPDDQLSPNSLLVTPIVDVRGIPPFCGDTFVYVADVQAFALIVHDVQRRTSWRLTDDSMLPDPNFGHYTIAGESFDLLDGILGMDLSPKHFGWNRVLFYHALSSVTENWVYTSEIRNPSNVPTYHARTAHYISTYTGTRSSQCAAQAIDRDGISYFGLTANTSINCWNIATEYGQENIDVLAFDETTLQFTSGIKVIDGIFGDQELWFLTMRFQKLATGTLTPNETNFRIQTARIKDLTLGSKCVIPKYN